MNEKFLQCFSIEWHNPQKKAHLKYVSLYYNPLNILMYNVVHKEYYFHMIFFMDQFI